MFMWFLHSIFGPPNRGISSHASEWNDLCIHGALNHDREFAEEGTPETFICHCISHYVPFLPVVAFTVDMM